MLKDDVRTISYKNAISKNTHLFKDKIVLDIGCGTGILSMFSADAGAAKVIGIDASDIIDSAQKIIELNGFKDTPRGCCTNLLLFEEIELIKGKVEEVKIPFKNVDIIAPNGIIFPDVASLYIVAIEDSEYKNDKINFWDNVYGYNMSCIKDQAYKEPIVDNVNGDSIVSTSAKLITIDINNAKIEDLTWTSDFVLKITRQDYIHALVAYFDIGFTSCHKPIHFDTSPKSPYTHWKQTVFYLKDVLTVKPGEEFKGHIQVTPNSDNHRTLDITIDYSFHGAISNSEDKLNYFLK